MSVNSYRPDNEKKPAKYCMLVHQFYPRDGRVKRYTEALVNAGAAVDVICVGGHPGEDVPAEEGVRVYKIPLTRWYSGRILKLVLEYVLAFVLYSVWLSVLYARNRYRVIHVHNTPDFLIFTALVPRLFGARLILDIHDPMPEFFMSKYHRSVDSLLCRLLRMQEKLSTLFADAVITANHSFKQHIVERGTPADKVSVVYNFPSEILFDRDKYGRSNRRADDSFVLLYPGTVARRYGLGIAIQALPTLVERIPNITLRIISPQAAYIDELKALAHDQGVTDHVAFLPGVPAEQIPAEMAAADIGIYTGRSDPHMEIAMPSKVLEYAMMGLPVVASRLQVLVDMFGDSVMFFEPGNVEEFADAVYDLYRDPERRRQLVAQTDRQVVEVHSWSQQRDVYFRILKSLLNSEEVLFSLSK